MHSSISLKGSSAFTTFQKRVVGQQDRTRKKAAAIVQVEMTSAVLMEGDREEGEE